MRVATTRTGSKIHLIDQSSYEQPPVFTACGREEVGSTFIKRPKPKDVCQVCTGAMLVRIGRLKVKGIRRKTVRKRLKKP